MWAARTALKELATDPSRTPTATRTFTSCTPILALALSTDTLSSCLCSHVSRYTMSTAYLATAHFRDQDSLSARITQARFTGMFRFSCKAFKDWSTNPAHAAAGILAAEGSERPDDYTAYAKIPSNNIAKHHTSALTLPARS